MTHWPYPFWIGHRGAGKQAPENTLAAFKRGANLGYRMFECDVKLSADGLPFLLHDASLERTTNGHGMAGEQPWQTLVTLDAGGWHSPEFAGEPLPTLEAVACYCLNAGYFLNIEIKPSPGLESRTGTVVANHAARLWQNAACPPLLTSFQPDSLEAARLAQPLLPRGLLLDHLNGNWHDTVEAARELGCVAMVCQHGLWSAGAVTQAHDAGLRALSYTVNDEASVRRLIEMKTDGIITDRVDLFSPLAASASSQTN